mgnify:FL=1
MPSSSKDSQAPVALRRRWTAPELSAVAASLLSAVRDPRPPHSIESPWGRTVDGKVDLRGMRLDHTLTLHFLTLIAIDVSHGHGELQVHEAEFTDSRFDGFRAKGGARLGRRFTDTPFREAVLDRARLSGVFERCDFTGARLRKADVAFNTRLEASLLHGADLSAARIRGTRFVECSFTDALFSALTEFDRCVFVGSVPDFGPARVTGCTVDGVRIPDQWEGAEQAVRTEEAFIARYSEAINEGRHEDLPLEP